MDDENVGATVAVLVGGVFVGVSVGVSTGSMNVGVSVGVLAGGMVVGADVGRGGKPGGVGMLDVIVF